MSLKLPTAMQTFEFRRHVPKGDERLPWRPFFAGAVVAASFALTIFYMHWSSDLSIAELLRRFVQLQMAPKNLAIFSLYLALALGALVQMRLSRQHERILLSPEGITYQSPWQGPWSRLQILMPDWRFRWEEIRTITLNVNLGGSSPAHYLLVLEGRAGTRRRLGPYGWTLAGTQPNLDAMRKISAWDVFMGRREGVANAVRALPLVTALQARGYDFSKVGQRQGNRLDNHFNITSHAGLKILLVLAALLTVLGALDWEFQPDMVAGPWPLVLLALVFGAAIVVGEMAGRGAPALERWCVALLFGLAAVAGACPLLLQANRWSAESPQQYRYQRADVYLYRPIEAGLPDIEFTGSERYWGHFKPGAFIDIELVRGELGFWQYNSNSLRTQRQEWDEARRLEEVRTHPPAR